MKKHYQTLGLQEGASQQEVQEAYDRLSKELDPTNNDNQEFFVEEYKKVQKAYEALSNSSILAIQGGAHKNILDQPTPSKKMDIPPKATNNSFIYLLRRKRNIITLIVLVLILKPVLHFSLFPETEQFVNYDKKIYANLYGDIYGINKGKVVLISNRDFRPEKLTKNGERYVMESRVCNDCSTSVFYHPKEIRSLSFITHMQQIFKVKLYLFFILILILSLIVFLFNDKIKAR
jgi:hypothetical protein